MQIEIDRWMDGYIAAIDIDLYVCGMTPEGPGPLSLFKLESTLKKVKLRYIDT